MIQRNDYESNVAARLELGCRKMILNDFGPYVSLINLHSEHKNWGFKRESMFDIWNNFHFLKIDIDSIVYFPDLAPQAISCTAMIEHGVYEEISQNTKVSFIIMGPLYYPKNYKSFWVDQGLFDLKIGQISEITPLGDLFPIEKPEYGFFNFYLKKIGVK
jgi:hypothetical protein